MAPEASPSQHHATLLLGHQLKREFALMHKQHQEGIISQTEYNERLRVLEAMTNRHNERLAAIDKDVRELNAQGLHSRMQDLEGNIETKLSKVHDAGESVAMRVDALEKDGEAERSKLAEKEKILLERVAEAEKGLRMYEQNLKKLDRQPNAAQLGKITAELKRLRGQVYDGGEKLSRLQESLDALAATNEELRKANEGLGEEMGRLKAERIIGERSSNVQSAPAKRGPATKRAVPTSVADDPGESHRESMPVARKRGRPKKVRAPSQAGDARDALHNAAPSSDEKRPWKRTKLQHRGGVAADQSATDVGSSPAAKSNTMAQSSTRKSKHSLSIDEPGVNITRQGKGWVEFLEAVEDPSDSERGRSANKDELEELESESKQRLTRRLRAQLLEERSRHPSQPDIAADKTERRLKRKSEPALTTTSQKRAGKLPATRKSFPRLPSSPSEPEVGPRHRTIRDSVSASVVTDPQSEVEYEIASPPRRRRVIEQSSDNVFVFEDD